jgi:hypothetical protein
LFVQKDSPLRSLFSLLFSLFFLQGLLVEQWIGTVQQLPCQTPPPPPSGLLAALSETTKPSLASTRLGTHHLSSTTAAMAAAAAQSPAAQRIRVANLLAAMMAAHLRDFGAAAIADFAALVTTPRSPLGGFPGFHLHVVHENNALTFVPPLGVFVDELVGVPRRILRMLATLPRPNLVRLGGGFFSDIVVVSDKVWFLCFLKCS